MVHLVRTLLFGLCLISISVPAVAQTPSADNDSPAKTTPKKKSSAGSVEAGGVAEQRRTTAISLLASLADEAKGFNDLVLRARVLARAADAMWDTDQEQARALLLRAWDAADGADAESARRMEEDIRKQQESGGAAAITAPPNLRNEVLRVAARRDRKLGEEFLKKIQEARERETQVITLNRDPWMSPASQAQRLRLATQLVQDGEVEKALEYADPALTSVTSDSMDFLSNLREKNAPAADQRFAVMLARAASDPASDANTVSGLSSYAFTPFYYVVFQPRGGASQMARRALGSPPDLPEELRNSFFQAAARILLRPSPQRDQDTTSAGRSGKYFVIKRLLPLFEKFAPEMAPELRVQMAALSPDIPENMRTGENRAVTRGIVPEDMSRDRMEGLQDRLDRAADAAERDAIYADMASALAGSGDSRARDLVDKIGDTELRKQVRAYTDFEFLEDALQKKDWQEAVRILRSGELTHIQRVWGLTQAARMIMKSNRSRAVELLDEATAEARRIGSSEPERARAMVAIVSGFIEPDRARAWEMTSEAVKAANSAEGFTGTDALMTSTLRFRNGVVMRNANVVDFDLLAIFRELAKDDLYRAIETAKNFTGEAPRANATLAIARTILEEKKK